MPGNNANRNDMELTEQTLQQVERFIKKIAQKFPPQELNETSVLTDIHVDVLRIVENCWHSMTTNRRLLAALLNNG